MLTVIKFANIFTDVGSTNASMTLDVHVVAEGHDNGLNLGCKFASRGKDQSYVGACISISNHKK
ncbi:hypothetical protein VI817_003700 [Penicillium citrinum]|nr:hypothetical protein VI817_003700 [Penicillium citrinum]